MSRGRPRILYGPKWSHRGRYRPKRTKGTPWNTKVYGDWPKFFTLPVIPGSFPSMLVGIRA